MTRRIVHTMSILLLMVLTLSACVAVPTAMQEAPEPTVPEETEAPTEAVEEQVTINIMLEGVPDQKFVEALTPQFEDETGIDVNFEILTYSVMREKLIPALAAQEGIYDVIIVDKQWVGEFVYAGWLEQLDPYIEATPWIDTDNYIPALFNVVGQLNDKTWMLPYYNYTQGLIYRKDLFNDLDIQAAFEEEAGRELTVPTTLEEYVEVAKFFAQRPEVEYGVTMQLARGVGIHGEWSPLFFGEGGYYFDENWNATVNDEAGVKALKALLELYEEAAPPGATTYRFDDAFAVMAQGDAAMMITYNWMLPRLNDPEQSTVVDKVALAPTPGGVAHQGAWGWAIPANAPHKDAAWKFLSWVESFDIAKQRALMGGSPTRQDVLEAPEVLAKYPHYTVVQEILSKAVTVPIYLGTSQQYSIIGEQFSAVVAEGKDPQEALDTVAEEMNRLVEDDPLVEQALQSK